MLIELHQNPELVIDIRYATAENFTGAPVYKAAKCFLHPTAAEHFAKAQKLAAELGYRFKIFDAFRPLESQQALWSHTPDPDFLSEPGVGSTPHCRGVAIDLNLIDKDGNELDMGTAFDAFTPLSHHANTQVSKEAQRNRFLLLGIMTAAGWDFYRNEWWHYQLFNARSFPLLTDKEAGTGLL